MKRHALPETLPETRPPMVLVHSDRMRGDSDVTFFYRSDDGAVRMQRSGTYRGRERWSSPVFPGTNFATYQDLRDAFNARRKG